MNDVPAKKKELNKIQSRMIRQLHYNLRFASFDSAKRFLVILLAEPLRVLMNTSSDSFQPWYLGGLKYENETFLQNSLEVSNG